MQPQPSRSRALLLLQYGFDRESTRDDGCPERVLVDAAASEREEEDAERQEGGKEPRRRDPIHTRGRQRRRVREARPEADDEGHAERRRVQQVVAARRENRLSDQGHQQGSELDRERDDEGPERVRAREAAQGREELAQRVERLEAALRLLRCAVPVRHGLRRRLARILAEPRGDAVCRGERGEHDASGQRDARERSPVCCAAIDTRPEPRREDGEGAAGEGAEREDDVVGAELGPDHGPLAHALARHVELERAQREGRVGGEPNERLPRHGGADEARREVRRFGAAADGAAAAVHVVEQTRDAEDLVHLAPVLLRRELPPPRRNRRHARRFGLGSRCGTPTTLRASPRRSHFVLSQQFVRAARVTRRGEGLGGVLAVELAQDGRAARVLERVGRRVDRAPADLEQDVAALVGPFGGGDAVGLADLEQDVAALVGPFGGGDALDRGGRRNCSVGPLAREDTHGRRPAEGDGHPERRREHGDP
mmetsp:Transcript_1589/g.6130  ORF Transcript_1589/g.6130 Transcript_1589/m.6130 type:complete len:482 (+) Transcript_1589:54-1499(+)